MKDPVYVLLCSQYYTFALSPCIKNFHLGINVRWTRKETDWECTCKGTEVADYGPGPRYFELTCARGWVSSERTDRQT